jgi:hypothetical protein
MEEDDDDLEVPVLFSSHKSVDPPRLGSGDQLTDCFDPDSWSDYTGKLASHRPSCFL